MYKVVVPTHVQTSTWSYYTHTTPPNTTPKPFHTNLDILPSSRRRALLSRDSHSREVDAVLHIARGHLRILDISKHLVAGVNRASHPARAGLALPGPVAERLAGLVLEAGCDGAGGHAGGVGDGEFQLAAGRDVQLLAAGDLDVLVAVSGPFIFRLGDGGGWKGLTRAEPPMIWVSLPGGQTPPISGTLGGQ